MDFGAVLSRTWQIIRKHKVLWIFGILAGCTSGGSNTSSSLQYNFGEGDLPPGVERFFDQFARIPEWQITVLAIVLVVVVLLLVILAIFLGTIGRIGLIRGTEQADQGAAALNFGDLFSGSMPYFWRVFLLNLLVGLALALAFIALVVFIVLGSVVTLGIGAICLIPLFCLAIPAVWFINIVLQQATIAIVVENLGITAGLQRGWEVVKNNLGAIIVMALILYLGVALIGGLIIGLPLFVLIFPALIGAMSESPAASTGGWVIFALCLVGYLPILIVLNGILRSYIESAWTLTFLRLTGRNPAFLETAAAS